jgi:hypothetical protein
MEVVPVGVVLLDQADFPVAAPSFETLLKGDRCGHLAKAAVPDQTIHAIALGEAVELLRSVLSDPPFQAVRQPA